ncbi:MAG: 3'-5' exonuclease, partial [Chloroflexota bacterium]
TDRFQHMDGSEALAQFLEEVALVSDADALGDEGTVPALLTLHTAKGLEFPVVFMVGMEEGIFPHSRSFNDAEQMEEERRLAYVGITRAKDRLYLSRAFRRATYGFEEPTAPSRFLDDIPRDLLEMPNAQRSARRTSTSWGDRQQQVTTRWHQSPQTSAAPPPPKADFSVGDRVHHRKFGDGTIISVEDDGDDLFVQVAFPDQGIKKLSTSVAPLKKL